MRSFDPKTLTSAQLKAARALIGLSAEQLARDALLGVATVRRAEAADGLLPITPANAQRLVDTLTAAGVELIGENGGGAGVRLSRPRTSPA